MTAQMVLVCCWRSMKEVATLLGQLCHSLPLHCTQEHSHTQQGLITRAQVRLTPGTRTMVHRLPPEPGPGCLRCLQSRFFIPTSLLAVIEQRL